MKKKSFDYKKLLIFGGIPTCLLSVMGFVIASSKTITTYAELPTKVEETKQEVVDIKDYIKEQQIIQKEQQKINQYYYKKEKDNGDEEVEPILSQDEKWFWNEELEDWRPIKELDEYLGGK